MEAESKLASATARVLNFQSALDLGSENKAYFDRRQLEATIAGEATLLVFLVNSEKTDIFHGVH